MNLLPTRHTSSLTYGQFPTSRFSLSWVANVVDEVFQLIKQAKLAAPCVDTYLVVLCILCNLVSGGRGAVEVPVADLFVFASTSPPLPTICY